MARILISIYDHEVDLIHFYSYERGHNLKVCFAAKIIVDQLLVGTEGGNRKGVGAGFFFFMVNYLVRVTVYSTQCSCQHRFVARYDTPVALDYHYTVMCQRNRLFLKTT